MATLTRAPDHWADWLIELFPDTYTGPLADHHKDFWEWVWSVVAGVMPQPYAAIWARGHAKSTNAENSTVAFGARGRRYALYCCGTQPQADDHVQNIGTRLESYGVERYYPDLSEPYVNKFGSQRGWRRNRLSTKGGFTVDAIGLDVAMRGVKLDDARPDVIILDDVDDHTDSPETVTRKINELTKKILPAGSRDVAVLVVQNLVHRNGIVAQLVDGRADFLANCIISGPHPAIEGMEWQGNGKDAVITAGTPTWAVMGIPECQAQIGLFGLHAFLSECQHKIELSGQPRFNLDNLAVMRQRCVEPLPMRDYPANLQGVEGLRVYAKPLAGVGYVVYTDPAEGKGRDYTATMVMEAQTRQLVAVLEDNTREPQAHAELAVNLWEWYNRGLYGYERAKGEALALVLGQRGVDRIYQHEDNPLTPQQWAAGMMPKRIPGFPMTAHTKRGLIDRHAERIDTFSVGLLDRRTIEQHESFVVTERMTVEAMSGGHDDLVIGAAGCVMLCEVPGAQSVMHVEPRVPRSPVYHESNPRLRAVR